MKYYTFSSAFPRKTSTGMAPSTLFWRSNVGAGLWLIESNECCADLIIDLEFFF